MDNITHSLAGWALGQAGLKAQTRKGLAALILGNSRHSNAENKRLIYDTDGMALGTGLSHELMRNAGFDPAMRKKGEPISGGRKPG